jgi:ATP-binding cassette, subfamily B, bacterial PglK
VLLQRYVRDRTRAAADASFRGQAAVLKTMQQALATYKELLVRGRSWIFADLASAQRREVANAQAQMTFIHALARYVLEGGLILGLVIVAAAAGLAGGTANISASIVLFAAAGLRVLPAIAKFQANVSTARYRAPFVRSVLTNLETPLPSDPGGVRTGSGMDGPEFAGHVEVTGMSTSYPNRTHPALRGISLDIPAGSLVAIVGPSGAGKTTLADALLGLLELESGAILGDGIDIMSELPRWRHSVGYIPQDVALIDDSVATNVALGWIGDQINRERVWEVLTRARADEFVRQLPRGLDTHIGAHGLRIAGGQRQRIGIARALYTAPTFLVLDEATSSLDVETERSVMDSVKRLHGDVTVVIVAHRLATIRTADLVVFLENGEVRACGSFEEVAQTVPRFAEHVRLAGLSAAVASATPPSR